MSTVPIALGERSYDIRIDTGLLSDGKEIIPWIGGSQVFIITNNVVAPYYLEKVSGLLDHKRVYEYILTDGEQTKNLDNYAAILERMLSIPLDRSVTVVALGGGVIGDLAGFVAASYQRGVPFIQIPTTLLSQVDSSVGGKTGVNHSLGKNMIGAFYQPKRVIADIDTLKTLDARQYSAGLAEIIKYGLINDDAFFCWLEQHMDEVMDRVPSAIETIVTRSCQNKANIVARDERESGVRALLNLGHTFGHAIETGTGYGTWLHGEAVATGIAMAAYMSGLSGWFQQQDFDRVENLLDRAGLPYKPFSGISPAKIEQLMALDKKVQDGRLRLVLLKGIGQAELIEAPDHTHLMSTLDHFVAS